MRRLPLRSPPRVRGKVFFFTGASFCAIFFLEPSGNLLLEPSGSSWVPPDGSIFVFAIGSPPRVRGKGVQSCNERVAVGITPAYAGKSWGRARTSSRRRDHPRVCGEKYTCPLMSLSSGGSPPRMRGKGLGISMSDYSDGITPAYAGKRMLVGECPKPLWDHPRVCGEKGCCKFSSRNHSGSPPRVRGKDEQVPQFGIGHGITPACAGKSVIRISDGCLRRDHPRVCGEKTQNPIGGQFQQGSPPAYAGKSMMLHHSIPDTAAHDGRQVLRGLRRHLKCDWDGHLRLVQVGNVVHERALMPDVHESQSRRTPQRHNDRMGQPVQAGMHGGSHGCRGRAAAPKCPAHHPWLLPPCRMVIKPRP